MATETSLWEWLKTARKFLGSRLHMRRVENAVGLGDPDVDGIYNGRDFSLELKVAKRPAKATTTLRFGHEVTPQQVEYAEQRLAAGGAHAFLIQVGSGADAARYVVHGGYAGTLARGVSEAWLKQMRAGTAEATIQYATNLRVKLQ
jgi:hypothetical protein